MALIKCPGCGREISSFAENCNYCGHPISNGHKERPASGGQQGHTDFGGQQNSPMGNGGTNSYHYQESPQKSNTGKILAIAIPIAVFVVIFALARIGKIAQNKRQQEAVQESVGTDAAADIDFEVPDFDDVFIPKER